MKFEKKLIKLVNKHHTAIFAVVFIMYVLYTLASFTYMDAGFPFIKTRCITKAVADYDYGTHFTQAQESAFFLKSKLRLWGYNPFYFAGYPSGVFIGIDNHWATTTMFVFGSLFSPELVFNLSILFCFLTLPLLAYWTARNYQLDRLSSLIFYILTICLIIGNDLSFSSNAGIKNFLYLGLYSFVLGVFLSFCTASLLFRYLQLIVI